MTTKQLKRSLTLSSVVLFGLAYMTPIIVLGTFGILAHKTHDMVPAAYIVALVAMIFTAYSYGRMAVAFPIAGSAYTYTRKAINAKLGFLVGWVVLLDYLFLPMVIWLIGAAYLHSAFSTVPMWVWIITFIIITTLINIVGLKMANTVNYVLMLVQFLVLVAFVMLSIHYVAGDASKPLWNLAPLFHKGMEVPLIMSGAAIACYSFLGFDAVSTLAEETKNPSKTIPRAIMLITIIGGLIFVGVSYFVQVSHLPSNFANPDNAAFDMALNIGGDIFASLFLIGLISGQFTSGLAAQASGSRLLYAMGRDGVLNKTFFGKISQRFSTPINNLILCGVVALLALEMDITTSTSFINFGAFVAFAFVNLSVICYFYIHKNMRTPVDFIRYVVFPGVGIVADVWLFLSLDSKALYLGSIWLVAGICYLAWLTKMFKTDPPELDFTEVE